MRARSPGARGACPSHGAFSRGACPSHKSPPPKFWERKTLAEMNAEEWESLCDGCARCCAIKLEDETTGEVMTTRVVCRLLDLDACRCTHCSQRHRLVPDCVRLTAETVESFAWLPSSCAYRRLAEGRGLAWWHPLVSGDPNTVVEAGISVRGGVVSEQEVHPQDIERLAVRWVDAAPSEDA